MNEIDAEQLARAQKLEDASVASANEALKALLLLNGGACIALLSFLAATAGSADLKWSQANLVIGITHSLLWFALGAGLAVLTCFFAYLSNQSYSSYLRWPDYYKRSWAVGVFLNRLGILTALGSLAVFGVGVIGIWRVAM